MGHDKDDKIFRVGGKNYRIDRTDPPAVLVEEHESWRRMTRSELLERKLGSKFWKWLRSEGVRRPSPPGPAGPPTPYKQRLSGGRVRLEVYLSSEAGEALDLAVKEHGSRRVAIEALLLAYAKERGSR